MTVKLCFRAAFLAVLITVIGACSSVVSNAGAGMASSISAAMLNQDDPEIVRDGAPAFLMMLDGMVENAPQNPSILAAASELYAAYGVVFVDDAERAEKLTARSRDYGRRALCATREAACGIWEQPYETYEQRLSVFKKDDVPALYTFALSEMAFIRTHAGDWGALARLPEVRITLERMQALDPNFRPSKTEQYLGVLNTIRPPALGGDFDAGKAHFEKALSLEGQSDFSIKVDYAKFYARTLYDRELHDQLLNEVLEADPNQRGFVLTNTLAQDEARALLESADDYF